MNEYYDGEGDKRNYHGQHLYGVNYAALDQECERIFADRLQKIQEEKRASRWHKAQLNRQRRKAESAAGSHQDQKPVLPLNQVPSNGPPCPPVKRRRSSAHRRLPKKGDAHVELLRSTLFSVYLDLPGCDCLNWRFPTEFHNLERGILHLLFADGRLKILRECILKIFENEPIWPQAVFRGLIKEIGLMWDETTYHVELDRQRDKLSAVHTFRARRKFPSPLHKYVGPTKYNITLEASNILQQFYQNNTNKPNREEKLKLSGETGISFETVTNWFKNRRQRKNSRGSSQSSGEGSWNESQPSLTTTPGQEENSKYCIYPNPAYTSIDVFKAYDDICFSGLLINSDPFVSENIPHYTY